MIELYSGTPGSGKSLHMAKEIYLYMNSRKNRKIIANFEIALDKVNNPDRFIFVDNQNLTPALLVAIASEFYKDNPKKEDSLILFIDEAQIIFNSRDWNSKGRRDWISFFTQHRKYGFKIVLVAQFDNMLDKQIRSLIEYENIHRKVSNFGLGGFLLRILTFGDLFIVVQHWYGIKKKTGSQYFKARKRYYELYDTFNTFNASVSTGK